MRDYITATNARMFTEKHKKKEEPQNWVFKRIRRAAKQGNSKVTITRRWVNPATERAVASAGYATTKNRIRGIGTIFTIYW